MTRPYARPAVVLSLLVVAVVVGGVVPGTAPPAPTAASATAGGSPGPSVPTAAADSTATTTAPLPAPAGDAVVAGREAGGAAPNRTGEGDRRVPVVALDGPPRTPEKRGVSAAGRADGPVRVAVVLAAPPTEADLAALRGAGASVELRNRNRVQATVDAAALPRVLALPSVLRVERTDDAVRFETTSEGLAAIGVDGAHAAGHTGAGVRVGVVDAGFDVDDPEIADRVAGARAFARDDDLTGGTPDHGTAVAELVLDVAPDADLYLATADTQDSFSLAVDWLLAEDVDVVTTSLGWVVGPHDGTGVAAGAVDRAREAGVLVTAATGNLARSHWEGTHVDADDDGVLEFDGSEAQFLADGRPLPADAPVLVVLNWADWPVTDSDFDLYLFRYDPAGPDALVAAAESPADGTTTRPAEALSGTVPGGVYYVVVVAYDVRGDEAVELFAYPWSVSAPVPEGSVVAPATAGGATGVGAFFHADGSPEPYSSRGPTNDGRPATDLAGPDGVTTTRIAPFFGTSAATPHVAGVAALVLSADGSLSGADAADVLAATADDAADPGYDERTGAGAVNATAAVAAAVEWSGGGADQSPFDGPVPGTGGEGPPTDPDGDGVYEDVDGDGDADFDDAVALAFADVATVNADPARRAALDVDGDGDVDFDDAVELAFRV